MGVGSADAAARWAENLCDTMGEAQRWWPPLARSAVALGRAEARPCSLELGQGRGQGRTLRPTDGWRLVRTLLPTSPCTEQRPV